MTENETLVDLLVKKGYEKGSAEKCVQDVLDARKEYRLVMLANYKDKRVQAEFSGIMFDVVIHDVKIDNEGNVQFQVKPLNGGNKMAWVRKININ